MMVNTEKQFTSTYYSYDFFKQKLDLAGTG